MGTPQFAVPTLEALKTAGHEILAVCTQPDRPAGRSDKPMPSSIKGKALDYSCQIFQPENLKSPDLERTLREMSPDLLVVVAYGLKLPHRILNLPKYGAINLHPSLLPRYRGAAPINWAIINGETTTGVSTIYLSERMDAGDIILQEPVAILPGETAGELETRLSFLGADLMVRTGRLIDEGEAVRVEQNESMATNAPKLAPEDGRIIWNWPSERIRNLVRGVTPKPGAFTVFRGSRLELAKIENIKEDRILITEYRIGQIVGSAKGKGPVVRTGDGAVALLAVKPAGKKLIPGTAFVNGYRPTTGEMLG